MSRPQPLLLLFDIDGTLLLRAFEAHRESLHAALHEVHGIADPVAHRVQAAGRTDNEIARAIALAAGVGARRIDERAAQVRDVCCREYARRVPADLSGHVAPGVPDLLEALAAQPADFRLGLVTGNFEVVARLKLRAAGIGAWFEGCPGAFGSDHEDRTELPAIARARAVDGDEGSAKPWPASRTVVIGDTPRDIACARADGVGVLAVATGSYPPADLAAADAVAPDATALLPLIAARATRGQSPRVARP